MTYKRKEIIGDCTLILGDCLEVIPTLGKVDAVVTDPPYGIADKWKGGGGHGWGKARVEGVLRNTWDSRPLNKNELDILLDSADYQIIWGGNYFELPPSRCWFVWNKPERGFTLAEAELAWTNSDAVIRVFDLPRSESDRLHPTQKPLRLMLRCLELKTHCNSVIDPFMGSGTTGVACVKLGRKFIGIELDEKYFDIACKRIEEAYRQPDMFIAPLPKPIQDKMI
jgi:site-specific DNA-methyltransferase (adenine-specific)